MSKGKLQCLREFYTTCRMTLKIALNEAFVTLIIALSAFFGIFSFNFDTKHCTDTQI